MITLSLGDIGSPPKLNNQKCNHVTFLLLSLAFQAKLLYT
nr:MAG TPA: hypothetical protein [Caudoviricetes sp.]